jgi:hypothetical protein
MNIQKTRDAIEDAVAAALRKLAIDKQTGFDADALAASMALFIWDDVEPVLVEQAIPEKEADKAAVPVDSAGSDQLAVAAPAAIDWSQYGRGKLREQPNAEITFYEKGGELRIRADFPAHGVDEVAARIHKQLAFWRNQI